MLQVNFTPSNLLEKLDIEKHSHFFSLPICPASVRPLPDDRIVGGYRVNITQHPYNVALIYDYRDFCGGSIISSRWILTSAGCIFPDKVWEYKVLVGATDKFTEGVEYEIESYQVHHKFSRKNYDYAFAVIRLKEEIQFHAGAQPIQLPEVGAADIATGTYGMVTGYGLSKYRAETSRYLRALKVPKVSQNLCKRAYEGLVTARMLCAGFYYDGGEDGECFGVLVSTQLKRMVILFAFSACTGDYGSPLVFNNSETKTPVQHGIVSWGKGCGIKRHISVYAKVAFARKWIHQHTGV